MGVDDLQHLTYTVIAITYGIGLATVFMIFDQVHISLNLRRSMYGFAIAGLIWGLAECISLFRIEQVSAAPVPYGSNFLFYMVSLSCCTLLAMGVDAFNLPGRRLTGWLLGSLVGLVTLWAMFEVLLFALALAGLPLLIVYGAMLADPTGIVVAFGSFTIACFDAVVGHETVRISRLVRTMLILYTLAITVYLAAAMWSLGN